MSSSTQNYADLARNAYQNYQRGVRAPGEEERVAIGGIQYKILEHYDNPRTEYQGTIYQRVDTGDIVVAHRGTEVTEGLRVILQDAGVVDGSMVLRRVNPQAQEAIELTRRAIESANKQGERTGIVPEVTTTGHSLGGCLAQITAHHFGLKGETFNAYGAVSLGLGIPKGGHDVVNHVMATDFVSAASPHYGQVRIYAAPREVAALVGAKYDNNDNFVFDMRSPLPGLVLNLSMHSMHHFTNVDGDGRPDRSILADPNARRRADEYAPMFAKFRDEVAMARTATTVASTRLSPFAMAYDSDRELPVEPPGVRGRREGTVLMESVVAVPLPEHLREGRPMPPAPRPVPADEPRVPPANDIERMVIPPIPDYLREAGRIQSSVTPMPADFAPIREPPKDLRDPEHPGHERYTVALGNVRRMEGQHGIESGLHSERLAAAVAIAVERDQLKVQRLELDKSTGQVTVVERGPYPDFEERRVPIDTRQALGLTFEQSSQQWLEARSPHYAVGTPAVERTREQSEALAQLTPADQAMFAKIREHLPASVSDDHVAQATLAAKRDGIKDAGSIQQVAMVGDKLWVEGTTPGYRVAVDVSQQAPPLQEVAQQSQAFNQQRDLQLAQEAQQRAQSEPGQALKMA